jgi:hypothetical protein
MPRIGFIFALAFFITGFLPVKANNSFRSEKALGFIKAESYKVHQVKVSFEGSRSKYKILKRRYKSRGIEVAIPLVSSVPLDKTFYYRIFLCFPIEANYASFLYCVDRKRGPPSA